MCRLFCSPFKKLHKRWASSWQVQEPYEDTKGRNLVRIFILTKKKRVSDLKVHAYPDPTATLMEYYTHIYV